MIPIALNWLARDLKREPRPEAYLPLAMPPAGYADLVVKTGTEPVRLAEANR